MRHMQATWGLALLGQDVETSAVVRYQLRFRQDVINLALVLYLQLLKHYWASVVGRRFSNIPTTPSPVRCVQP